MRILPAENLRFPEEGSSTQGKSGPKSRPKGVDDGQPVENPVLPESVKSNGVTRKGRSARRWKAVSKRVGNPGRQTRQGIFRDVMGSEIK